MAAAAETGYPPLPPTQRAAVTLMLALAVFMNVLDVTIANVSIPTIAGYLAVSADHGTWVITSFAVSNAIAVPISGWLARRFGEVRLFVVCTLLFTLFSWFCGISNSFVMLLVFRALQGAVAGPMIPLSQSLLLANYPQDKRGFANGIWGMTAVVGPVAGPFLGGWITDNISWSWIFYINIPVGLSAAFGTWIMLRERETAIVRQPVDKVGLVLLIVGVGCLQIMLDQGNEHAWFQSSVIVKLGLAAGIMLSFFIIWELTDAHPVVDLSLFKRRNFAVATFIMTFGFMTYFSGVVVFPLWLQTQMQYTPAWAGITTASLGLLGIVFSPLVGRLADRMDLRVIVCFGLSLFAVISFIDAFVNTQVSIWLLVLPRLVWGLGTACFFIPLITLSLQGLSAGELAHASGLFNFLRQMALAFGTSLSITLWDRRASLHDHRLTANITEFSPAVQDWYTHMRGLGMSRQQADAELMATITHQSFMLATNDVFLLSGVLFLVLAGLVWIARPQEL